MSRNTWLKIYSVLLALAVLAGLAYMACSGFVRG